MKRLIVLCMMLLVLVPQAAFATSWDGEFVVYENSSYMVTTESVSEIGEKLGEVTHYSDMYSVSGNFSNHYPVGTAYYKIIGIDVSDAIAVEVASGKYVKAAYEHEYVPMSEMDDPPEQLDINEMPPPVEEPIEPIEPISVYMWFVIAVAAAVLVLVFIIGRKERE